MLKTHKYESLNEPLHFFVVTFFLSWLPWFFAIYLSWQPSMHQFLLPLFLVGLAGPAMATLIMLMKARNSELWDDFFRRLCAASIKRKFIPIVLLLFPCLILLAITISLFFGQPTSQFAFITQSSDLLVQGKSFWTFLFVLFSIGPLEEIGWRYGIDSLRTTFNLINTSLIFAVIWGLWHVPLFFLKNGGLQKEFWDLGLSQTFMYFTGLFLITIITNWLYVKNNRSILSAILFHSMYDTCFSVFSLKPLTWFILWLLSLLTSVIIVQKNKDIFFKT